MGNESIHLNKTKFQELFGTELDLLEETNQQIQHSSLEIVTPRDPPGNNPPETDYTSSPTSIVQQNPNHHHHHHTSIDWYKLVLFSIVLLLYTKLHESIFSTTRFKSENL